MKLTTIISFFYFAGLAFLRLAKAEGMAQDEERNLPHEQHNDLGNLRAAPATKSTNNRFSNLVHVAADDTPRLRLEQTNALGWGAQTWELFGNEVNVGIRDISSDPGTIPLRIRPGAPTDSIYIHHDGSVGVGVDGYNGSDDIRAKLDVRGDAIFDGTVTSPTIDELRNDLDASLVRISAMESTLETALERIQALEALLG